MVRIALGRYVPAVGGPVHHPALDAAQVGGASLKLVDRVVHADATAASGCAEGEGAPSLRLRTRSCASWRRASCKCVEVWNCQRSGTIRRSATASTSTTRW